MAITKGLRFEILRRDKFRCTYCGVCNRKLDDLRMRAMEIVEEYDA